MSRPSIGVVSLVCSLVILGCADPAASVETRVHLGPQPQSTVHNWAAEIQAANGADQLHAATQVWKAWRDDWRRSHPNATHAAPSDPAKAALVRPTANATRPPTTTDDLDELVTQLRTGPIEEIALPAHNLRQCAPSLWPQLRALLESQRKGSKTEFKRILTLIGGDVPNRYGHFALNWKRDHGYAVKLSEDWFSDLLAMPMGKVSHMLHPVYRDAILVVAAMHGAAKIAREDPRSSGEVVDALLDLAYADGGTFRDEVGRAITSIGDEAVPHLVLASAEPEGGRDDDAEHLRARYATYNLDQLDRLAPDRAIAAASGEPRRLIALLEAYGSTKPGDAAIHILDATDDPSPSVRAAARESFNAYVTGPPPRMKIKSVRRLGGQTVTRQAYLSYRALAANAIWAKLEAAAPELLEAPCEIRRDDGSYNQACIEQPARLAQAYFAHLDEKRRAHRATQLDEALALAKDDPVSAADSISLMLRAEQADLAPEQVETVAQVLLRAAAAAEETDLRAGKLRAAATFLAQNPATSARADAVRAQALRIEAENEAVTKQGRAMLLAQAQALSPMDDDPVLSVPKAQHQSTAEAPASLARRVGLSFAYLLAAFGCLAWLGARGVRRRRVAAK